MYFSRRFRCALALLGCVPVMLATPALAQVDPRDGIDWVTIGAANNPAYAGPDPNNAVTGRGSVSYEYRIGRYEATGAQWGQFLNAAFNRPDPLPWVQQPSQLGGGMQAVGGVTWRTAAMYCNWLHNNKATNREAFLNGAYDVSTFGVEQRPNGAFFFTDQWAHNPGARYWIPTLDEWMKAAYYDPNRNGPNQGGWWQYNITSDTAPIYGAPLGFPGGFAGAQANSGFRILPGREEFQIPLGAYGVTSPWGLYDTAGATREWLEEVSEGEFGRSRLVKGSGWAAASGGDIIWNTVGQQPSSLFYGNGLRLASIIPSPGLFAFVAPVGMLWSRRRTRSMPCVDSERSSMQL